MAAVDGEINLKIAGSSAKDVACLKYRMKGGEFPTGFFLSVLPDCRLMVYYDVVLTPVQNQ
jgi:hypothetical protein